MKNSEAYLFEDDVDLNKEKKIINDEIFNKRYEGEERDFLFSDLPLDLQPTDIIRYVSDSGYYSENNSWDPFTELLILRPRWETDDEQSERLERSKLFVKNQKEKRRKIYLNLKKEFDSSKKV